MEDEKIEQRSEMIKNTELQKEIKNIMDSLKIKGITKN